MQYCLLQHRTLLSPPDTSTTECHFCFGPATSFFLKLLVIVLYSSHPPVFLSSILGILQPGGLIFQCHIVLPFHTVHRVLETRILKWIVFSSPGYHVLSELFIMSHSWPCISYLITSMSYKMPVPDKAVIVKRTCSQEQLNLDRHVEQNILLTLNSPSLAS